MNLKHFIGCLVLFVHVCQPAQVKGNLKVIYAINAGSHEHTDQNGITYEADPLVVGTASDYGNHLIMIGRVPEQDEVLYRTERYHTATFGYDLPLSGDGDYALILKFCEVYFNEPNQKVFDVVLNKRHTIVSNLDIYHQVGRGTAHDEYVFFKISGDRLLYRKEESVVVDNMVRLEFIKGVRDNPKINAFALLKGDVERIPRLMPITDEIEDQTPVVHEEISHHTMETKFEQPSKTETVIETPVDENEMPTRTRMISGPRKPNPYEEENSYMLPLLIAIGAFIPLLFCLCKL